MGDFGGGEKLPLSADWGARLFTTPRDTVLVRLPFDSYLVDVEALLLKHCCGLPCGAVGGVFLAHGCSVFFLIFFETATDRNT